MSVAAPKPVLSMFDVVAATAGIIIGAGIFRLPSTIAGAVASEPWFLGLWVAGGAISLIGALCYAELATAFPSAGGEYHFLTGAYGPRIGFLFAWSRFSVAQTGNIALLGFVFGDYLSAAFPAGPYGPAIYAAVAATSVTLLNVAGLTTTAAVQRWLFGLTIIGFAAVVLVGLSGAGAPPPAAPAPMPTIAAIGSSLVMILFSYGGWNEAAYVSAEVRNPERNMLRAMMVSIAVVTACYIAINWTYVAVLGLDGVARSQAVASDVMRAGIGDAAAAFMTAIVLVIVLKSMNVCTLTGARTAYALGRDTPALAAIGVWDAARNAPVRALWLQLGMALLLILGAALDRGGVSSAIDYLSPVFWLFLFLNGVGVMVLRAKFPTAPRPFRVPLYPWLPLAFCGVCGFLVYSSISFAGTGALVGLGVLALGVPIMLALDRRGKAAS